MHVPQWIKSLIVGTLLTVVGWALTDRISIGERISRVEAYIADSIKRLDRIEHKIDEIKKEQK